LLGLSFSVVNIPYSALMPMMTARRAELVRLGSLRAAGTAISGIVVTAATLPMVHVFGGGDDRRGFLRVALLFAGISVMLIFNLFAACRERIHDQDHRTIGTAAAVAAMLRNRAWVVVFLFIALNFMRFGTVLAVTAFFAVNVLHRPWMISALLPAVSGTLLIGSFIAPPLLRRWGMRMGNRLALIVAVALYLVLPFLEATPGAFIAAYLGASVALSITMTAMFAMAAETVDYHEQLFRIRNEGLLSSGIALATKLGMALGSALVAYGLAIAGYHPGAISPQAVNAMRVLYYAPAILIMLMQIICIQFYPTILPRQATAAR
jgi:Na+/melibiose symporter-like transporter